MTSRARPRWGRRRERGLRIHPRLEAGQLHRKVTFQPTPKGVAIARARGGEEGRQLPATGKAGQRPAAPGEEPRGEPGRALPPQCLTSPASRRSAPWTPETLTPTILEHFALGP